MATLVEHILERKGVKVCRYGKLRSVIPWRVVTSGKRRVEMDMSHAPYLSARALMTSQLIPPMLIQRTLVHGSRRLALGSERRRMNSTFVMRPKLVRMVE